MGGRALALAVMVAMAVGAAATPALAAVPKVRISKVALRADGTVVRRLPRGAALTFDVTYRVRHLSKRSRCRAKVTVELRRLTSRFDLSTPRSAAYAESGTYLWPVGGAGARLDARYPAGLYRMTVRVRIIRPSGRTVATDVLIRQVRVV
jgi:hypothetical protein